MNDNRPYVWYASYGSNLCKERFLHYIYGGNFKWGGKKLKGCKGKVPPCKSKFMWIPHSLYFANKSSGWRNKGVAFISTKIEENKNKWAIGRLWKITKEQYLEVCEQEGNSKKWYGKELYLGKDEENIPIITITNGKDLPPNEPSEEYIRTVIVGLRETYSLINHAITDTEIINYLSDKPGIVDSVIEEALNM